MVYLAPFKPVATRQKQHCKDWNLVGAQRANLSSVLDHLLFFSKWCRSTGPTFWSENVSMAYPNEKAKDTPETWNRRHVWRKNHFESNHKKKNFRRHSFLSAESEQNLYWGCGAYKLLYPMRHGVAVLLSPFGQIYIFLSKIVNTIPPNSNSALNIVNFEIKKLTPKILAPI